VPQLGKCAYRSSQYRSVEVDSLLTPKRTGAPTTEISARAVQLYCGGGCASEGLYTAPPPWDALLLKFRVQLSLGVHPCGLRVFSFVRLPRWSAPHRLLPDKTASCLIGRPTGGLSQRTLARTLRLLWVGNPITKGTSSDHSVVGDRSTPRTHGRWLA